MSLPRCDCPKTPETLYPPDRTGYQKCRLCHRENLRWYRYRLKTKWQALLELATRETPEIP